MGRWIYIGAVGRWIYIGAVDLHRGGGFTQGRWGGGAVDLHRGGRAVGRWGGGAVGRWAVGGGRWTVGRWAVGRWAVDLQSAVSYIIFCKAFKDLMGYLRIHRLIMDIFTVISL